MKEKGAQRPRWSGHGSGRESKVSAGLRVEAYDVWGGECESHGDGSGLTGDWVSGSGSSYDEGICGLGYEGAGA
ncbi:hypothetical protein CCHR01_19180 [Colletotrichum chrysophilum]|uniref:Uncharacterized protein n=1 Tax=Colletotrichum chrysophilum TaxID=1836956 RepID=A0AAD9E5D0_9PEZI|nr:hypothetical protein CCHR01_19180 [Colletotrichum chrysophilum]